VVALKRARPCPSEEAVIGSQKPGVGTARYLSLSRKRRAMALDCEMLEDASRADVKQAEKDGLQFRTIGI
jgi:hypothetical protein